MYRFLKLHLTRLLEQLIIYMGLVEGVLTTHKQGRLCHPLHHGIL